MPLHEGQGTRLDARSENEPGVNHKAYVYPCALRTSERILSDLKSKVPPLDVIGVVLGVKTDSSLLAPGLLSPLIINRPSGDKLALPDIYAGLHDKTTLYMHPFDPLFLDEEFPEEGRAFSGGSFEYDLVRKDIDPASPPIQHERVTVMSLPCTTPRVIQGHILDPEHEDFAGLHILKMSTFRNAVFDKKFSENDVEWKVIESSSAELGNPGITSPDAPAKFTPEQRAQRNDAMMNLLSYLGVQNDLIKAAIAHRIDIHTGKRTELVNNQPVLEVEDVQGGNLQYAYRKLVEARGENKADALMRTIIDGMHADLYSAAFRTKERERFDEEDPDQNDHKLDKKYDRLKTLFTSANFGVDILHLMPLVIDAGESHTTTAYQDFKAVLDDTYNAATDDGKTDFEEMMADRSAATLTARVGAMKMSQERSIGHIAKSFGFEEPYVNACWIRSATGVQDMIADLRSADTELMPLLKTQVHEVTDEVKNATLPELIHIYHRKADASTDEQTKKRMTRMRFEAGRQLVGFFHELMTSEEYDNAEREQNLLFSTIVDDYFGPQTGKTILIGGKYLPFRSPREGYSYVKNEKDTKQRVSYRRKAWSKSPESSAKDIHGSSVTLGKCPEDVDPVGALFDEIALFNAYMLEGLGGEYDIEIAELEKPGLDLYERFLEADEAEKARIRTEMRTGKNTGSNGHSIVKVKTTYKAVNRETGDKHQLEVLFHPYAHLDPEALEAGFMGSEETRETHSKYEVRRMMKPLNGGGGLRSLYDLYWPAAIYEDTIDARKLVSQQY